MHRTKAGSWTLIAGMIALGAMLAACNGDGSSANNSGNLAGANGVTLSWQPPTENTDGTPLTDLSGYTIHYGTQSESYTSEIQIDNPGLTTYVVDNLSPGTYYFAVTASGADGFQSEYSPEVSVTVN
jgi:hypothetical protein